jgi:hypothetical protein
MRHFKERNRVFKFDNRRVRIWERVSRSALVNCSDDDWQQVISMAQHVGVLPYQLYMRDLVAFNERAAKFNGSVSEFLRVSRKST